jgi:hypothetical protein
MTQWRPNHSAAVLLATISIATLSSAQKPTPEIVRTTSAHLATLAKENGLSGVVFVAKA